MSDLEPVIPARFPRDRVMCGFTTRNGGVSVPPYDSLNLGRSTSDDEDAVAENRRLLLAYLNVEDSQLAEMRQVHGGTVRIINRAGVYDVTDGIISAEPGLLLTVLVADCIPLLMYDPMHHAAAAVHCGWRPLVAGIVANTVSLMTTAYGTDPSHILVAAGPGAGVCCYEIGTDVSDALHADAVSVRDGKIYGDLRKEMIARLTATGVNTTNVEDISDCTIHMNSFYFSHRRDGRGSGRMMGYILLR